LGTVITVGAFIYLLFTLVAAYLGKTIQGWTSMISVVLILGGIQLISLGIMAQYIGMIFEQVKNRPLYILKKILNEPGNSQEKNS
jgi:dolichol-phosphate mannosyltransferase